MTSDKHLRNIAARTRIQMRLAPAGWPAQERIHAVKHAEHALLLVPL